MTDDLTFLRSMADLSEFEVLRERYTRIADRLERVGLADSILRKLATEKGGFGNDYVDPALGIVDATADLTLAESEYLLRVCSEVER